MKNKDNYKNSKVISDPEVLKKIHITEKSTNLITENNQYTFRVFPRATKNTIKKAIQDFYKVNVENVKIIKIPSKKKKIPMVQTKFGWKKGYKKAIIKLKSGEKIEF